jgi:signal transduction histidine kinase
VNLVTGPEFPKLYVAWAEWGACLLFLLARRRAHTGRVFWLLALGALVVVSMYQRLTEFTPLAFWLPGMGLGALLMFVFLAWGARLSPMAAAYTAALAFAAAEFTQSVEWQFHTVLFAGAIDPLALPQLGFCLGVYAVILGVLGWFVSRYAHTDNPVRVSSHQTLGVVLTALTAFLISNLSFVAADTPFSARMAREIFYIRTLVDACGLIILFAIHEQHFQAHMRHELQAVQDVLNQQYLHYQRSKEAIDIINRKYHDLKHQIQVIRQETDRARQTSHIDALHQDLDSFEGQRQTGNPILDTLLGGKSLECRRHGITLNCVADGALLGFIDVVDLCTIFGNVLDNAIESTRLATDPDKRVIKLAVYRQKDFLMVRCENYFDHDLRYEDGRLVSTKGDGAHRGYGLRSLQYSAERYGGSVSIRPQDHWFILCLLVPLPPS